MSHLELKDAVLPATVTHPMVQHLFSLLDCPEIDDQAMVRKIAALDFINRIFADDPDGKARETFFENGILDKLNILMKESTQKDDKLSLILSTASLSLVYRMMSIPIQGHKMIIPNCFLEYFLTIISENKLDSSVKLAVGCICLLEWEESDMKDHFIQLSGFETLLKAAKSTTRDVMIDIIRVFSNFALRVDHVIKFHMWNVGLLKYTVEICDMYLKKKIQFGGNGDNLLMQCMIFLNNFLFKYYKGKMEFYKLGGMKIITELYYAHTDEELRNTYIERVLKILLYYSPNKDHTEFFMIMNRCGELTLRKRYPPGHKMVEESLTDCQLQTDLILWNKSSAQTKEVRRSYQIGSVVPFINDSIHAIMPSNILLPDNILEVGTTACGMLNCQKYCTIYFGINPSTYKVEGVITDRDLKDRFRLACDNIFNTFMKPSIGMSSNIDVQFVPIKNKDSVILDLFIAEILIKPYNDFFSFKQKTYFRYNNETMLINAEMLQLLAISDESKRWHRKEEKWLKKLNELKATKNSQPAAPS